MLRTISIAGVPINLDKIGRDKLKGLTLDLILSFRFYYAEFNKHPLCPVSYTHLMPEVEVHWYDGGLMPERPACLLYTSLPGGLPRGSGRGQP